MPRRTGELHTLRELYRAIESSLDGGLVLPENVMVAVTSYRSLGIRSWGGKRPQNRSREHGGEGGVCTSTNLPLPRPSLENQSKGEKACASAPFSSAPFHTWLTPYFEVYQQAYGEAPVGSVVGRLAKALKEAETAHPRDEVVRRFGRYCKETSLRFWSPSRFVTELPRWSAAYKDPEAWKHDFTEFRPGESHEAYIIRQTSGRGR